ncbi:taurine---2-oxoglutarate transaminase [Halogranum amylolyticum]|uniref:Taurine---2-oxoglutarate transaminase n=1 Tax=Halogranum amylolyticum TaxID=660520 RepID=A0A1H8WB35_9EURY|nr:aminotransferase class III-fold pyridoxal phosphate-dependent enzyme [Halogranum amylolyticum]SEP24840.1 taurine---2-oxoglutarate transaminase [Halogranum amylolyticum]
MLDPETPGADTNPTIPHWNTPGDEPLSLEKGDGTHVYDEEGEEYLDFTSQLYCVNAGHSNENIIDGIRSQLDRIQYVSSAEGNDVRTELARRITDIAPESLSDVYFSISGSEANESAIQIARDYQGASTVLSRWRSYHGSTYATGGLTGDSHGRLSVESHATTTNKTKFLPPLGGSQSPFDADSPEELAEQAADHLEYVILNQGPDSIAALVTEIVGGSSGAYTAPPGYFERVQDLCDKYDILLIADEVITGFGRCGEWFGSETENIEPDMITFAKGVTSAYVPLGGVLVSDDVASYLRQEGLSFGQTFAGNPLACAAGLAAIDEYENLMDNVRRLGPVLHDRLESLTHHDVVGEVRGRGLLAAVEFVDPETGDPVFDPRVEDGPNPVKEVIKKAKQNGVMFGPGRPAFQVIMGPPFCTTEEDIDTAVTVLDQTIDEVF